MLGLTIEKGGGYLHIKLKYRLVNITKNDFNFSYNIAIGL